MHNFAEATLNSLSHITSSKLFLDALIFDENARYNAYKQMLRQDKIYRLNFSPIDAESYFRKERDCN